MVTAVCHSFCPDSFNSECSLQLDIGLMEVSGFCYTINARCRCSPELLWGILLLPCVRSCSFAPAPVPRGPALLIVPGEGQD